MKIEISEQELKEFEEFKKLKKVEKKLSVLNTIGLERYLPEFKELFKNDDLIIDKITKFKLPKSGKFIDSDIIKKLFNMKINHFDGFKIGNGELLFMTLYGFQRANKCDLTLNGENYEMKSSNIYQVKGGKARAGFIINPTPINGKVLYEKMVKKFKEAGYIIKSHTEIGFSMKNTSFWEEVFEKNIAQKILYSFFKDKFCLDGKKVLWIKKCKTFKEFFKKFVLFIFDLYMQEKNVDKFIFLDEIKMSFYVANGLKDIEKLFDSGALTGFSYYFDSPSMRKNNLQMKFNSTKTEIENNGDSIYDETQNKNFENNYFEFVKFFDKRKNYKFYMFGKLIIEGTAKEIKAILLKYNVGDYSKMYKKFYNSKRGKDCMVIKELHEIIVPDNYCLKEEIVRIP